MVRREPIRFAVPAASACAAATSRIGIGIGIVNPYTRHPTLIAMEFGALDELAEGRAMLGIGSGIGAQIERLGYRYRPLVAMQDAIHIVRALLAGDTVRYRGKAFSADNVALKFPPPRPNTPIYMAAMGDRSLALCGRIADGLIVSNMCPPAYTQHAVGIVAAAAKRSAARDRKSCNTSPASRARTVTRRRTAKAAIGIMLTTFWPVGEDWPPLRETTSGTAGSPNRRSPARSAVCAGVSQQQTFSTTGSSTRSPLPEPPPTVSPPPHAIAAPA